VIDYILLGNQLHYWRFRRFLCKPFFLFGTPLSLRVFRVFPGPFFFVFFLFGPFGPFSTPMSLRVFRVRPVSASDPRARPRSSRVFRGGGGGGGRGGLAE
jgi:hypothetical protein